ncbi:MAG: hypothetical protein RUMPE_00868 [Eubacteriales bacterium SKADARSKE-1]|nr:hypothetical protein [Eubacteriales bacterium SKADARSKE-1]
MAFYDSLKLEKGMYNLDFTKALEELDPSENYEGTDLASLDAYERQLKRFNIKVNGKNSDIIEKFFQATDSAVLFPEYVKRAVEQGLETASILPSIVSTITKIDGNDYRTITLTTDETSGNAVTEGVAIPETVIKNSSSLVTMKKRGRVISSSYESLRLKRLDLFSVALKQIGADIARAQLGDAVTVLAGGTNNTVSPVSETGFAYADLIAMWAGLAPYELNTILANTAMMQTILSLTEMKDAEAGLTFQGTGKMITPLGSTLVRAASVANYTIVGFDKNCALEMVQAGDVSVDFDRLIDKQLERTIISSTVGFARVFEDSIKKLTYTPAST